MLGAVTADGGEPRLSVPVLRAPRAGDAPEWVEIEAVVDTGFDGELQLPPELVRRFGYPYEGSALGALADGSEGRFDYHSGEVLWHGTERGVLVISSDGDPLIGMALLGGSRLTVDAVPGGAIRVERL